MSIFHSLPWWFIPFILAACSFAIYLRRRFLPFRTPLKAPSFVRIIDPLPDEAGRVMLLSIEDDECRVGLRDGSVRSYSRDEIEPWR